MRVILDANVLIAAIAGRGLCESVPGLCRDGHDLIISQELLVTGDKDLIGSGWRGRTKIVTPRQFWERCRNR